MWKSLKVGAALSGVLLLGLAGCGQQPPASGAPKAPSLASQQWDKLTAGFIQSYLDRPAFLCRAIRPPRIRRSNAGCQQAWNQA